MKKINNFLAWAVDVIFYPFLTIVLVSIILFFCGVRPYITMSGSMEPEIRTGSICFVNTKAKYSDIGEGDIIAYQTSNGGLVTHRVISIADKGMETKGDANDVSDGITTTAANFHGKTLFSIPCVGYIMRFLQQPTVIAIALILIAGIAALNMVDSKDEKKQKGRN